MSPASSATSKCRSARRSVSLCDSEAIEPYALKYAICVVVASRRPLGDHSSPVWSPIALVEYLGVGDGEHAGDVLGREIVGVGVEIGRQRHRAERHQFAPAHERCGRRTHPTSTSATARRSFAARGRRSRVWRTRSPGRRWRSAAKSRLALDKAKIILLDPGRRDLWVGQGLFERLVLCGNGACWCDHDGRRSANTAVASVATSPPPCVSSTRPVLRRAVGLDQANVEIEGALRDRRAVIDGERQRIAGSLRMIDQRPQDGGGGGAAERADKSPVILAGAAPASGCRRRSPAWRRRKDAVLWSA